MLNSFGLLGRLLHGLKCLQLVWLMLQSGKQLGEIGTDGDLERQYKSSLGGNSVVNFVDISGRIVITDSDNRN